MIPKQGVPHEIPDSKGDSSLGLILGIIFIEAPSSQEFPLQDEARPDSESGGPLFPKLLHFCAVSGTKFAFPSEFVILTFPTSFSPGKFPLQDEVLPRTRSRGPALMGGWS